MEKTNRQDASFRDPAGFLFASGGILYRQVNAVYRPDYELLLSSGLYAALAGKKLLIPHDETDLPCPGADGFRVIRPEKVPFISYPYEWCFSQLKAAALLTLEVQKLALAHGMTLRDASAYNVQFHKGQPVFIDTLSFAKRAEGSPWAAYGQFCRHFLAPLALMAKTDLRLNCLSRDFIDGVPLDLASSLLPLRTWLDFSLLSHLHFHAKASGHYGRPGAAPRKQEMSGFSLDALLDSLEGAVKKLAFPGVKTEWGDYYAETNYSEAAFEAKKLLVSDFIEAASPQTLWDLGANSGEFSRLASAKNISTLAFDSDPVAVEKNYRAVSARKDERLLPLLADLANPAPGTGWANRERASLAARGPADCVMALALIHHLAIGNNLPFEELAGYFASLGRDLIIEFVPKEDSMARFLLSAREDVFPKYAQKDFEAAFSGYFAVLKQAQIPGSGRTLYLMRKL
ncbi:MAG TPA: SAM-dependent methyltransferase [Elusimicrobia bacterium]|nr:MAG: hypothetical protein A2016_10450 [Elusimicrobia bacterium GWF2_62_30]HBA59288.1 SAM-dependent methyltransferase [Elusimicrobiota bacterium]